MKMQQNGGCEREQGYTFSMGTPRVSGTRKAVKMSARVCQTPKKTKTPYFMLHIMLRNDCSRHTNS